LTYDGAAAWWASSTTTALKLSGENLCRRSDSSRVWYVATVLSLTFNAQITRDMVWLTHKSALPDALCLLPCSISTTQSGRICFACDAACFASSMLLTMTSDFVAPGLLFLGSKLERSEIKTAVLPAPVGRDTPMREVPAVCASRHALRQIS
jgi:hypothetical protein